MERLAFLAAAAGVTAASLLAGCATPSSTSGPAAHNPGAGALPGVPGSATQPASVADVARKQAEQLAKALAAHQHQAAQGDPAKVRWLTPEPSDHHQSSATQPKSKSEPASATQPATQPASPTPAEAVAPPATVAQLLHDLDERLLETQGDTALHKAMLAAAVGAAQPDRPLDPRLLAPLSQAQRELVLRYGTVVAELTKQLASGSQGSAHLDRAAIDAQLDRLLGEQPVRIRNLALCRSVSGYGVYDPFADHSFLAAQDHKMVLYVELAHFRSLKTPNDRYQVKLEQEVVLYNEADGLAVWKHAPVQITDTSRNQRHDFFVVQLIDLPARLSVGKYRLKVRITDLAGGSVDETTTRLQIVADKSLVQK